MSFSDRQELIARVRSCGGWAPVTEYGIIRLTGVDAEQYLQGRTSNDVKAVQPGLGQLTTFLHRKGHVLALFSLHRLGESFLLLAESSQLPLIKEQLETYLFREKVTIEDVSSEYQLFSLQGPATDGYLIDRGWSDLPSTEYGIIQRDGCLAIKKSLSGETGFILAVPTAAAEAEARLLASSKLAKLDSDALELLRIEAGIPKFGIEVSSDYLLPETALEQVTASYTKGCFQGQEVLARIKTYGAPRQALVGLIFDSPVPGSIPPETKFTINGQDGGTIKSNAYSPTFGKHVALAYIVREFRVPETKLELVLPAADPVLSTEPLSATVMFLPLYSSESSKELSRLIYKQALSEFANGSEPRAIEMLRKAIDADPHFADAYESLGVILSRQNQLDEAISLMHRLAELDPQSIMAHANLSVYYMQLGEIEKAEEQKALSMSIQMSRIAKEVIAKRKDDEERKKRAEEAAGRMEMFGQVLLIDKDDLLANYGMGSALLDSGQAEKAVPYLRKAIEVKPTHTVAWLALGKALEELHQIDEARQTYEQGVLAAARRGDITPMNEMKARLEELKMNMAGTNS